LDWTMKAPRMAAPAPIQGRYWRIVSIDPMRLEGER
jgi:hypothetical protein